MVPGQKLLLRSAYAYAHTRHEFSSRVPAVLRRDNGCNESTPLRETTDAQHPGRRPLQDRRQDDRPTDTTTLRQLSYIRKRARAGWGRLVLSRFWLCTANPCVTYLLLDENETQRDKETRVGEKWSRPDGIRQIPHLHPWDR